MFAPLQQQAALLLNLNPGLLLAAQTAGGALGSMLAPAKILVGCSTVGLKNGQGEVLRLTIGYGLSWLAARFVRLGGE
jgi:lactate permease